MKKMTAILVLIACLGFYAYAGCYVTKPFTCHSAASGTKSTWCLGAAKWFDDAGFVLRAKGLGEGGTGGWNDIGYDNTNCSYTHHEQDCSRDWQTTTVNDPIEDSYATGSRC